MVTHKRLHTHRNMNVKSVLRFNALFEYIFSEGGSFTDGNLGVIQGFLTDRLKSKYTGDVWMERHATVVMCTVEQHAG